MYVFMSRALLCYQAEHAPGLQEYFFPKEDAAAKQRQQQWVKSVASRRKGPAVTGEGAQAGPPNTHKYDTGSSIHAKHCHVGVLRVQNHAPGTWARHMAHVQCCIAITSGAIDWAVTVIASPCMLLHPAVLS